MRLIQTASYYRYDGGTTWTFIYDTAADDSSRAAVYDGKLYINNLSQHIGDGTAAYSTDELDDNYNLITATYDGSVLQLYVNGILKASSTKAMTPENNTLNLYLGRGYGSSRADRSSGGEDNFRGTIDEVKIFNTALTAEEVAGNYSAEKYGEQKVYLASVVASTTETSLTLIFLSAPLPARKSLEQGTTLIWTLGYNGSAQDTSAYDFPAASYDRHLPFGRRGRN